MAEKEQPVVTGRRAAALTVHRAVAAPHLLPCGASSPNGSRQGSCRVDPDADKLTQRPRVDTCGAHFPRLMSEADALQQPAASAMSESFTVCSLGRISRRNSSGSCTVPGFACSHSASEAS